MTANPEAMLLDPPPPYETLSSVSEAKKGSSNSVLSNFINETLEKSVAMMDSIEIDPSWLVEHRASEARGYLRTALDGCERLLDSTQRSEFLTKYQSLCLRLKKILEEQKGEEVRKDVEKILNTANAYIDCFSSPAKEEEIEEVESLIWGAKYEIKKNLSASNYQTLRNVLLAKRKELVERLKSYKDNIIDSQQTTQGDSLACSIV